VSHVVDDSAQHVLLDHVFFLSDNAKKD